MPECRRMPLMNTKSGTAMNEKLDAFDQAIEPTTPSPMVNPLSQRRPSMPTIPSAIDTSTPAEQDEHQPDQHAAEGGLAHASLRGVTRRPAESPRRGRIEHRGSSSPARPAWRAS